MAVPRIVLLHATPVAMAPIAAAFRAEWPEAETVNLLDDSLSQDRSREPELTPAMIEDDADTFQNARLWDYRPLRATLDQLQTVRTYYDFTDVDTDRYPIGDDERQVMLSARELALTGIRSATTNGR